MKAKEGDFVQVRYTGRKKSDNTIFDSNESPDKDSLKFRLGSTGFIPGFIQAIVGMEEGEVKNVVIPKEMAYGEKSPALIMVVPRTDLLGKLTPKVGKILALQGPRGNMVPGLITKVTSEKVTIDMNSPLAGEDLKFRIYLEKIKKSN